MKIPIINEEAFYQAADNAPFFVAEFFSDSCMSCRMLRPLLEQAAEAFPGVSFAAVNIAGAPDLAEEFRIMVLPTLLLFRGGTLTGQLIGLRSKAALIAAIRELSGESAKSSQA